MRLDERSGASVGKAGFLELKKLLVSDSLRQLQSVTDGGTDSSYQRY